MSQITLWVGFHILIVALLALDLGVLHRKSHEIRFREALILSGVWIAIALVFNAGVFYYRGQEQGIQFLTAYLLEKSLSVDNIFVFLIIFRYFHVAGRLQHKILYWGIVGALIMRLILIVAGVQLIQHFDWITYIFGAFLIFTGVRMAMDEGEKVDPGNNPALRALRKIMPVTEEFHGEHFFVRQGGKLMATPMLAVLVVVEMTDLIFAVDSIPAVIAVSRDPFIVYTSNVFAILGLRSLYFALAGVAHLFHYLVYGLAAILVFVGGKMVLHKWVHVDPAVSFGIIMTLLAVSMIASLISAKRMKDRVEGEGI